MTVCHLMTRDNSPRETGAPLALTAAGTASSSTGTGTGSSTAGSTAAGTAGSTAGTVVDPSDPATPGVGTVSQPDPRPRHRPVPRPMLLPGLRRLWRGRRSLQLGLDPARAVVLELPDTATARMLDLLDGTRSERAIISEAKARYRITHADARALLDALYQAGLVVGAQSLLPHHLPEPVQRRLRQEAAALALQAQDRPATPAQLLRRRAAARVAITGSGPLVAPIAVSLAQAGVGHVVPTGSPEQSSGRVDRHTAEEIRRAAPGTRTGPVRRRDTSFVIQVGTAAPAVLTAAGYAQHRLPHLVLLVREGTVVVGPLVPPSGSPCLNCLDQHRIDRDPAWPIVAAQLTAPVDGGEACAAVTVQAAAALAAGEVLSWLDQASSAVVGSSVEVSAPGRFRRRSWQPHPRCDCHARARPRL